MPPRLKINIRIDAQIVHPNWIRWCPALRPDEDIAIAVLNAHQWGLTDCTGLITDVGHDDHRIYSKTLKWHHESEYRLAIPLGQNEEPDETLSYHLEEITEMYLGLAMDPQDREEIIAKARLVNPHIAIFQAKRDVKGAIAFDPI
jgi:hypothetical protein